MTGFELRIVANCGMNKELILSNLLGITELQKITSSSYFTN